MSEKSATARVLITAPGRAKRGERIVLTTLIEHVMESGFRHTDTGVPIPRDIVTRFRASYNGIEILEAELFPAIAANPYLVFSTVARESGSLQFEWTGDNGFVVRRQIAIAVE